MNYLRRMSGIYWPDEKLHSPKKRFLPGLPQGLGPPRAPPALVTFVEFQFETASQSGATFSFTLPSAKSSRLFVVNAFDGDGPISGVTIDGNSMTRVLDVVEGRYNHAFFQYQSGTLTGSVDVVITADDSGAQHAATLWYIDNLRSITPEDTASDQVRTGDTYSISLSVTQGGAAVGQCHFAQNEETGMSWTGLDEDFEDPAFFYEPITGASRAITNTDASHSISCEGNVTLSDITGLLGVSWR